MVMYILFMLVAVFSYAVELSTLQSDERFNLAVTIKVKPTEATLARLPGPTEQ